MFALETHGLEFGDLVKIKTTPETQKLGVAEKTGELMGMSDPTSTGVEVVGKHDGVVLAVDYGEQTHWVRPELIEFVERPPLEMSIGNMTMTRDADGNWVESRKPWWRFW